LTTKRKAAPEPREWLGPSALMDFDDKVLRAMARAIANGKKERERAVLAHAQVRALPLAFNRQARPAPAGAVLRRREGDAVDKATLLVALLRLGDLPARLLFAPPPPEALRGLPVDVCCGPRPMVEVCIEGAWQRTDTFIFDERYIRAAHHRLRQKHRDAGYGIALSGAIHWDGRRSASVLGADHAEVNPDQYRYNDAAEYAQSLGLIQRVTRMGHWAVWTSQRALLSRSLRSLRARQPIARRSRLGGNSSMPA
jgi:hypothetical protein